MTRTFVAGGLVSPCFAGTAGSAKTGEGLSLREVAG
jgi:hypothetical protein